MGFKVLGFVGGGGSGLGLWGGDSNGKWKSNGKWGRHWGL